MTVAFVARIDVEVDQAAPRRDRLRGEIQRRLRPRSRLRELLVLARREFDQQAGRSSPRSAGRCR